MRKQRGDWLSRKLFCTKCQIGELIIFIMLAFLILEAYMHQYIYISTYAPVRQHCPWNWCNLGFISCSFLIASNGIISGSFFWKFTAMKRVNCLGSTDHLTVPHLNCHCSIHSLWKYFLFLNIFLILY